MLLQPLAAQGAALLEGVAELLHLVRARVGVRVGVRVRVRVTVTVGVIVVVCSPRGGSELRGPLAVQQRRDRSGQRSAGPRLAAARANLGGT